MARFPIFRTRRAVVGVCPVGCYPLSDGTCDCHDVRLRGITDSPIFKPAVVFLVGVAAGYFGGGYLATRR